MHQTKTVNLRHFRMKYHILVGDMVDLVCRLVTIASNAHDLTPSGQLLYGEEISIAKLLFDRLSGQ